MPALGSQTDGLGGSWDNLNNLRAQSQRPFVDAAEGNNVREQVEHLLLGGGVITAFELADSLAELMHGPG